LAKRDAGGGVEVEAQVDGFLAKFSPEIEKLARACRAKLRKRLPGATELVYDNTYALVIGFGPSERASEAFFSLVMYPRWINFFFLQGAKLADPHKLLKGSGSVVRHIRVDSAADFDRPEIRDLMDTALMNARKSIDPRASGKLVIKAIAAKQRPRRPVQKAGEEADEGVGRGLGSPPHTRIR
jgi:Domain of unknown function (DU1801)